MTPPRSGWIGVDLDGTLAVDDKWEGPTVVGTPIPAMVERVKNWLKFGFPVKIVTARVAHCEPGVVRAIEDWCLEHIGTVLPMTNAKDFDMIELWDDRAVQVVHNHGEPVAGQFSRVP